MIPQPRDARGRLASPYAIAPGWRVCATCQQELPETQFTTKRRDRQTGEIARRHPHCRECAAAAMRAWRERNAEHYRAYEREHYHANRDHHLALRSEWEARNPEAPRRWRRTSYERHREAILARRAAYAKKTAALRVGRNRMFRAVEQGREQFPGGFVLVRIEDVNDWRPARPGVPLRRHEFALARFVRVESGGWGMASWPVVDAALRHWLPRLRRGLRRRMGARA